MKTLKDLMAELTEEERKEVNERIIKLAEEAAIMFAADIEPPNDADFEWIKNQLSKIRDD